MKKMHGALLLFLAILTLSSYGQKSTPTTLSGHAADADRPYMLLRYRDNLDTVFIKDEGRFSITINLSAPEECRLLAGKQQVKAYLIPGDALEVQFSMVKPDAPVFTGTHAAYSNFFMEMAKNESQLVRFSGSRFQAAMNPAKVVRTEDSLRTVRTTFIENYAKTNGLSSEFLTYYRSAAEYLCLSELAMYRRVSGNYGSPDFQAERPQLDDRLASLPTDNIDMLYSEYYQSFVRNLVGGTAALAVDVSTPDKLPGYYAKQFSETLKIISNQECRNYLLKELVVEAMKETGTRDIRQIVDQFNSVCTNEAMKKRVAKVWEPYSRIQAGMLCPPLEQFTVNGETHSMSELIGKVVYIDIWATWCGPCKKEIPNLKKLEEDYHGKNVEFVSISVDKDLDAWRKFVADQQLGGTQWHQSDQADRNISILFAANSIPRFILLDEKGRIITADAPRPSSGDTIHQLIDQVLNH